MFSNVLKALLTYLYLSSMPELWPKAGKGEKKHGRSCRFLKKLKLKVEVIERVQLSLPGCCVHNSLLCIICCVKLSNASFCFIICTRTRIKENYLYILVFILNLEYKCELIQTFFSKCIFLRLRTASLDANDMRKKNTQLPF